MARPDPWNVRAKRKTSPTGIQRRELMIVVIGGPDALADAARRVALVDVQAAVAVANGSDVAEAAAMIAECQPFAILLSADLYAFDSSGFDAIARDVRADVIPVRTKGRAAEQFDAVIRPPLKAAAKAYTMD